MKKMRNLHAAASSQRVSSATSLHQRPAPRLSGRGAGSLQGLKVLSFGWELAPILSGGLGVACAGLGRALVEEGVELTFVLPKLPRPISPKGIRVRNARDVPVDVAPERRIAPESTSAGAAAPDCAIRFETVLAPYQTHASYRNALGGSRLAGGGSAGSAGSADAARGNEAADASLYGGDLLAEVDRMAEAARSIAADTAHDLIHCHDWMTFAAGVAAREVSGKPLVVHVHSTESDRSGGSGGNAAIRAYEQAGLVAADRIVAVSDFTRRKILEQYPGVDSAKLRVVHNGIEQAGQADVECPPLGERHPVVLFLGRLTAQKGPEWFLRAAELVHRLRPDTQFVVAGGGEMLPWMIERAADLGLAASFFFTGFLSGDDIVRAYEMADVFVMPSVSEPFGLVPVEAMLRGTPAIVSRQSGVSEVIRHCLKVDFWDTADLADKIIGVIDHRPLAESLSSGGRREASRMDWQGPARRLLAIFSEVLAEPRVLPTGAIR
ncbi:MAG TPA: glycosyltransferase [Candidatus Limnocylindrales bacterium]|nr:glycosyltransferase [Candidatus Limnocylindrales bacterium]